MFCQMLIFKKSQLLIRRLALLREQNKTIGFVPTMGALHDGHLVLISTAKKACDIVVASIFVNPTQFNDPEDLEKYPRTPEKDVDALLGVGCDILFFPGEEEIYPETLDLPTFDLNGLDERWEGAHRPGHFDGVAQVVYRLLEIVNPDFLFLGQKDFQQVKVVEQMLRQTDLPTVVQTVPIQRAVDGLALSSRNVRLSKRYRAIAPQIHQVLDFVKKEIGHESVSHLVALAMKRLIEAGLKPEYFAVVDPTTLQPVTQYDENKGAVIITAVWAGEVRLIDNMLVV